MSNDQWNQGQSGQWPSDQDGNWGAQPEAQQSSNEWGQQPQASANEWNAGADQQAQSWNQQPQASTSEWNAGQDQQAQAWDQQGQQQNWDQQQPQASAAEWNAGQPQQQGQAWDQQGQQQNWNQAPGQYQQQQWQNPSQPSGGGLFSLDFTKFSLPQSGKLVWLIGIIVIAVVWLFDFISLLTSGTTLEIGGVSATAGEPKAMDIVRALVSGLAVAALQIVLLRVAIEGVIALVKIAENGKSDD